MYEQFYLYLDNCCHVQVLLLFLMIFPMWGFKVMFNIFLKFVHNIQPELGLENFHTVVFLFSIFSPFALFLVFNSFSNSFASNIGIPTYGERSKSDFVVLQCYRCHPGQNCSHGRTNHSEKHTLDLW